MSKPQSFPPLLDRNAALFLDFDGTLSPLQDDPDAVFLEPGMDAILMKISSMLGGALAILSGRDLTDLSKRVPNALWRFGNHGLRAAAPGHATTDKIPTAPDALVTSLITIVDSHTGVRLEEKGPVLAVHYRAAPDKGDELTRQLEDVLSRHSDYSLQSGKMVLEAKPSGANKGVCLQEAMETAPFAGRTPVMIGDDKTDEDAFLVANRLGGWSVKVGDGDSAANYRLGSHHDVAAYLQQVLGDV
ncbi:trehalose-phosphatase [uncultured Hyphomonas sp.]|jgi:trehalose 6-phosphate phosphatase|uniref:trehalose-phosphatase n=1 Tax=uncultured Hyphomonas sp. TaxID=225298 RepID=UPI0030D8851E|tara:strand:+ start:660 stop:1394 length:735 start_codon:yes stop_codon:yes gene_type:complete